MKVTIVITLLLAVAAERSLAQQQGLETFTSDAKIAAARLALREDMRLSSLM